MQKLAAFKNQQMENHEKNTENRCGLCRNLLTMKNIKIAIDPGVSGAIAIERDGIIDTHKFSTETEMVELLNALRFQGRPLQARLEKVHSMPTDGKASAFTFGANFGFWRGALQALQIPFAEITPQTWQKKLGLQKIKGVEKKRRLKQLAAERFPAQKPTLATADALLILATWE